MKQLRLKALALGGAEMLTRAQMKNVLGGEDCPGCGGGKVCGTSPNCNSNTCTLNGVSGTCGASGPNACGCATVGH